METPPVVHLINYRNLPVDSLNGLTSSELDLVAELSGKDCRVDELVGDFITYMESSMCEDESIADLPAEFNQELKDLDDAEIAGLPASSRKQMEEHGQKFVAFLKSRGLNTNLDVVSDATLNQYLRIYYFQLKSKEGRAYSPSSLVCIRAGIQRYLNIVVKHRTNLVALGTAFDGSNRMLQYKVREYIQSGQCTQSYDPIEEGDMLKLRAYFDRSDAERLQYEVLFELQYQLGERGQEHLKCFLTKNPLIRRIDADGRSYACLPVLPSKNRRAELNSTSVADDKHARIYDTELLDLYEASIPATSESFLPRPIKSTPEKRFNFSTNAHRGYRFLQDFMSNLSEKAQLSKRYTNHCIRVTRICDLDSCGQSVHDIMLVTGHKSESAVRRYLHKRRDRSLYKSALCVQTAMKRDVNVDKNPGATEWAASGPSTSGTVCQLRESEQLRVVSCPEKRM